MVEISVMASELVDTQRMFVKIADDVGTQIEGAMENLSKILTGKVKETFDLGGARDGEPAWIEIRNPSPLVDTGVLQDSIQGKVETKENEILLTIYTESPYAAVHNEGGDTVTDVRPTKKTKKGRTPTSMWEFTGEVREMEIPQREFLFLTDNDEERINTEINVAIETLMEFADL